MAVVKVSTLSENITIEKYAFVTLVNIPVSFICTCELLALILLVQNMSVYSCLYFA